jgi:hypothetical protein
VDCVVLRTHGPIAAWARLQMAATRNLLARSALTLALLMPCYFLAAAMAMRFDLVDYRQVAGVRLSQRA